MGGAPMMIQAAPAGGEAAPVEEEKEPEKTIFTVKMTKFDDKKKISVIKEVRAIFGLGLKEAKSLVESTPCTLGEDIPKIDADVWVEKLKAAGAEVALE